MFKNAVNKFAKNGAALVSGQNQLFKGLMLHEYQAAKLFEEYGIAVPKGGIAKNPQEALKVAEGLPVGSDYIVKAQVLAGGRGRGHFIPSGFKGGVQVCYSPEEVSATADKMCGQTLITKQTGATGKPCNFVYIAQRQFIRRELYFAILNERAAGGPCIVASGRGGVSIEDVAAEYPEEIATVPISFETGPTEEDLDMLCAKLHIPTNCIADTKDLVRNAFTCFKATDCTLLEINPLALTNNDKILACDAKVKIDDNAIFRQRPLFELQDDTQIDAREVRAAQFDLNYIHLDGNIGCMVNGAGLAMATMDIIKLHGGEPANFLDVGGSATETQVMEAFRILDEDPQVEAILVNIFGGIMRCDIIALGIIKASATLGLRKPLVVRLKGTNVEKAKELIENSGLGVHFDENLDHAAEKSVKMAEIIKMAQEAKLDIKFEL